MNIPSVFVNQRLRKGPDFKDSDFNSSFLNQKRSQSTSKRLSSSRLYKPLTSASKNNSPSSVEKYFSPPKVYKTTTNMLTTTPFKQKAVIVIDNCI